MTSPREHIKKTLSAKAAGRAAHAATQGAAKKGKKVMSSDNYVGKLLIAMPSMPDMRFSQAVIYICSHNEHGAMGVIINRAMANMSFTELLEQLDIKHHNKNAGLRVQFGGPVEAGRGFVLHSDDYQQEGTIVVQPGVALTSTVDVLRAVAEGDGPEQGFLALGYAGWENTQLDAEIEANAWLLVDAPRDMLFDADLENKWERAIGLLGFAAHQLSTDAGRA